MTDVELSPPAISPSRMTPGLAVRDIGGVAKRNLLRTWRTPQLLLFTAIQPIMLLIMFRYIFGGAIKLPGGHYVDFVVPAIFIEAVLVGSMTSAIGIAEDLKSGMIDRFRSLPMARSAVLAGRSLTDLIRSAAALAIMVVLGIAVGFRFHSDAGRITLGMLLILAFGYSFCWVNASIGISAKDPESATSAGTGPTFLLLFASNAIVPLNTLPGWLQPFARNQPLSVTATAVRRLFEGGAATHYVWLSLVWSAGITVVFFLASFAGYKKAAAK
jgi:ABC-2 type transport system permease protein/oleandomycin transport system permease protein